MQHTIESYKKWKRDFKNVHGKEALNALKMEFGTDDNYQLLEGLILENCYFAFHYEKESDINVVNRRKWGQELTKEINRQINDAKRIRDFAKRNPLVPGYGFQFGLGKNPNLEFSWRGEGPYPFSKALEAVLDQYIGILEKPNPIINSDNATHCNHIGALIFPNEPNNKSRFNKLNPLVNSLTYKLIDVFKSLFHFLYDSIVCCILNSKNSLIHF